MCVTLSDPLVVQGHFYANCTLHPVPVSSSQAVGRGAICRRAGTVKLKDLDATEETVVPLADIAAAVHAKLSADGDRGIIAAGRAAE